MDLGESLPQAAVRETLEETGIHVEITGLVGIYTDPRHVILYTSNGEARQEFSVVFTARPVGGEPTPSERVPRGPLGRAGRDRRAADGPVDADADRPLPGRRRDAAPWIATGSAPAPTSSPPSAPSAPSSSASCCCAASTAARPSAPRTNGAPRPPAISAWVEVHRKPDGGRELAFHIHNASDMPIYEVELPLPAPPGDERAGRVRRPRAARPDHPPAAPPEWLRSYVEPEPVQIEFLDSAGRRWTRDEQGSLAPVTSEVDRPGRCRQRRLDPADRLHDRPAARR